VCVCVFYVACVLFIVCLLHTCIRCAHVYDRVTRWHILKPKIPVWVNSGGYYNGILWPFGTFYCYPRFGALYQETSGRPGLCLTIDNDAFDALRLFAASCLKSAFTTGTRIPFLLVHTRVAKWYAFKPKIQVWLNYGGPWNEKVCYMYSMAI
jgi:hypothetical protein